MSIVHIEVIAGATVPSIQAFAAEFLGPDLFRKFRAACLDAGATYVPSLNGNAAKIDHLPGLLKHLIAAGFTPRIGAGVKDLAQARAWEIETGRAAAEMSLLHPAAARLFEFQREGVPWLAQRSSAVLADEMGLGKTPQSLLAAARGSRLVIICPASLKGMWLEAVKLWRPDLKPRILESFAWPDIAEAVIINPERLPLLPEEVDGVAILKKSETSLEAVMAGGVPQNLTLIADECHAFKNSKAKRSKRFRAIARAIRKAKGRTWGLTGTPMPNRPLDLLNVLQAFDLLKESFGSYPRFIELMSGRQDYWGKWTWGPPKPGAAEALRRVMLRRRRVDVMKDLPDAIFEDIVIELEDLPKKARQADAEARAAMAAAGVSAEDLIAGRVGGIAAETVFRARRLLAEALVPHAIEVLEEYQEAEEPLIIFCAHAAPIEAMGGLPGVGLINADVPAEKRIDVANDFQAGKTSAIAATIKTAATGFTLTRAAHVLFIDEEWTPDWADQAVARSLRIGQKRNVLVKRFVIPGTVFEDVRAINAAKRVNIAGSVDRAAVKTVVDTTAEDLRRIQ